MNNPAIAALRQKLSPVVLLNKARLETLCLLIVAMVSARTVNLSHLACEHGGTVQVTSTYRRLQRFFQYVRLPQDWFPMLGREVIEGEQRIAVLDQLSDRLFVFDPIGFDEIIEGGVGLELCLGLPDVMQMPLGFYLQRFRQRIQHVHSQRYERGSILITNNLPFDEWTEIFGSERLTGALLDRITHHVNILEGASIFH